MIERVSVDGGSRRFSRVSLTAASGCACCGNEITEAIEVERGNFHLFCAACVGAMAAVKDGEIEGTRDPQAPVLGVLAGAKASARAAVMSFLVAASDAEANLLRLLVHQITEGRGMLSRDPTMLDKETRRGLLSALVVSTMAAVEEDA